MSRIRLFRLLAVLFCGVVIFLGRGSTSVSSQARHAAPPRPIKHTPCATAPAKLFSMFVPLAHARYFGGADLMLNNRGVVPHEVTPTWYIEGRGAVVGATFTLPAHQANFHSMEEFLPRGVRLADVGGLELSYMGHSREVWAQANLRPQPGAEPIESLDAGFGMTIDYVSARLETVWPVLLPAERVVVALANTSADPLTVHVTDPDGHTDLHLAAHSGTVLNVATHAHAVGADWMRLEHDGAVGALRAAGFVLSALDKRPRLMRFFDPAGAVQQDLFATGLPLGNMSVTIALKNTTTTPLSAAAELLDPTTGTPLFVTATVQIPPGGAALIAPDLAGLSPVTRVGVRIVNSNATPGSLIGTLHGTNRVTHLVYDVPLRDSGGASASTGSYPWRLDGDYESRMTITNVGTTPARVSVRLYYGDTNYVLKPRELPVGGAANFDIRELRDDQVKDSYGQTIPANLEHGQFAWSLNDSRPGAHFLGRAEIVSLAEHVSSSFSCPECCPNSFLYAYFGAGADTIAFGDTTPVDPEEEMSDCYDSTWDEPASVDSWAYDTSVISVDGGALTVTGVGSGSTSLDAYWGGDEYTYVDVNGDIAAHCDDAPEDGDASGGITVKPTISGLDSVWWFAGPNPPNYKTTITLTSSGGSGTTWTIVAGSGEVSLSTTTGSTTDVSANTGGSSIAYSTSVGDIKITATANGQTSNQKAITLRAPYSLGPLTSSITDSCTSGTAVGYTSRIHYKIIDRLASTLSLGLLPLNEYWTTGVTDVVSNNWVRNAAMGFDDEDPTNFADRIDDGMLAGPPTPFPAVSCGDNTSGVHHWTQQWFIGDTGPSNGMSVQKDELWRYLGNGIHLSITSPWAG